MYESYFSILFRFGPISPVTTATAKPTVPSTTTSTTTFSMTTTATTTTQSTSPTTRQHTTTDIANEPPVTKGIEIIDIEQPTNQNIPEAASLTMEQVPEAPIKEETPENGLPKNIDEFNDKIKFEITKMYEQ
ncbi:hypothetical protein OUZ56_024398 [Daphnia magna]|uniref:Uncharacterized protein n=1 Tax=Daphnia magna TaxID=35525 RepID=A0ABR0B0R7_9CRUS|nr:hypothetical protein OUZ56_024398 [Daphnia magna]